MKRILKITLLLAGSVLSATAVSSCKGKSVKAVESIIKGSSKPVLKYGDDVYRAVRSNDDRPKIKY